MVYDLNLRTKSTKEKESKLLAKRMFELGWDCVAWNLSINGKATGNHIKPIPCVPSLEQGQMREAKSLRSLATKTPATELRQISRLTVTVDDVTDAQSLHVSNPVLGMFDIVAARPGSVKVFAHLCKQADIDIIMLDFTHRIPFSLNKKLLDEAVKRGIHFEISYGPILSAAAGARKEVFANTKMLIQFLRGRNLLISSSAESWSMVRGPLDVANIGMILGLNQEQAMKSIADNCVVVLQHGAARRRRYLPVEVVSTAEFNKLYPEVTFLPPPGENPYDDGSSSSGGIGSSSSGGSSSGSSGSGTDGVEDAGTDEEGDGTGDGTGGGTEVGVKRKRETAGSEKTRDGEGDGEEEGEGDDDGDGDGDGEEDDEMVVDGRDDDDDDVDDDAAGGGGDALGSGNFVGFGPSDPVVKRSNSSSSSNSNSGETRNNLSNKNRNKNSNYSNNSNNSNNNGNSNSNRNSNSNSNSNKNSSKSKDSNSGKQRNNSSGPSSAMQKLLSKRRSL